MSQDNKESRSSAKDMPDALFLDRHSLCRVVSFHRCLGTLLFTPQQEGNPVLGKV